MSLRPSIHPREDRGFALVVTLTLLVLLTVIAVGLLSLSSIVLRSSSQGNARIVAEGNARMALMLAIGQLQTHAGPDQRVTATADLAGSATGDPVANSASPQNRLSIDNKEKGLSSVQDGTRHWTGVWKNRDTPQEIYRKTPSPELVQWLISGNEISSTGVTPATPLNAGNSVVLVGENSPGNRTSDASYHVSAPLVEIAGSGSSAKRIAGRYAWWVGDEGVKARFNLVPSFRANDLATYENFSSQRSGWEVVGGFEGYPLPGSPEGTRLNRLVSMTQASLLSSGPPYSALSFHAATADSFGVIADTLHGGLRLDLSSYLRGSLPGSAPSPVPNAIVAGRNIIPTIAAANLNTNLLKGPTWDRLKEFADFASLNMEGGVLHVRAAPTIRDYAIAPVIVDLRLLLGARLVPVPPTSFQVHPCAKIAVVLANPYPYPLKWDGLDMEIKNSNYSIPLPARVFDAVDKPAYVPAYAGEPALFNRTIFRIPGETLPPGEAMAYTIGSPATRPTSATPYEVNLVPISGPASGLLDFRNSLIMTHQSLNPQTMSLDVREGSVTTQINVELRPQGSPTALLRVLERLELDNAEYAPTTRRFAPTASGDTKVPSQFTQPFPLQLYSFQLSQPGADYGSYLPSQADLGLRSSTMRTFADFNLQATRYRKPIISYNPPPYFMEMANSSGALPFTPPGGQTGGAFTRNLTLSPIRWGRSPTDGSGTTVLFSPPAAGESLVSLAQFQHADLTADDIYASVAHQPGNAVGNSYASPFVTRESVWQRRQDYMITNFNAATPSPVNYYDISYLLNAALWDTYYFSSIPATGPAIPENPRLVRRNPSGETGELRDGDKSAAHLLINGAFNINSTNKDAWKAFLAGSKHLRHPADAAGSADALFPRSLRQTSPGQTPPSGEDEDSFAGFRRLDDNQIDALAEEITRQVRLRGPFVSISHFVNRALVRLAANRDLGRSGALQSALDISGANISPDGSRMAFTDIDVNEDRVKLLAFGGNKGKADLFGDVFSSFAPSSLWPTQSRDANPGTVAGILADLPMLSNPLMRTEQGFRSTGIPGWVTQADLLQVLGPSISARSDTFRIRAYGEALDAAGNITAKAWCEAIVQRTPEYLDPSNPPTVHPSDNSLSEMNQTYGRKFDLVSFRWLSPDEI